MSKKGNIFVRILKEGYPFIGIFFILGSGLLIASSDLIFFVGGILCGLISLFCLYFFRDPQVEVIQGNNLILSPCNGRVLEVNENETEKVIRVFLSVFDVHLQRSPVSGKVLKVEHKPGRFFRAMSPRAHVLNEQNVITIGNERGKYIVKQIAGVLARRCISWVNPGDFLKIGDKIGLIKFGSQVDLHLPKNLDVKVKQGDKVVSGVTVFATFY
jgi:phosphatidylserine decarboxylase